jgi:hypothetical protein
MTSDHIYTDPHKIDKRDFFNNYTDRLIEDGFLPREKPETFQLANLSQLPVALERLKGLPRWVVWKWAWKEGAGPDKAGKWDKPPFQARNPSRFAQSNNPKTWGSFTQACAAVAAGKADGIGFMLLGAPIAALDLDNCFDPSTAWIDPTAQGLIDRANSYCEVTVSGTGFRIIGTGSDRYMHTKKAVNGSRMSVEAYRNCARYITVSGEAKPIFRPHNISITESIVGVGHHLELPPLNDIDLLIDDVVAELSGQQQDFVYNKRSDVHDDPPPNDPPHKGGNGADDQGGNATLNDDEPPADDETLALMEAQLDPDLRELIQDGVPIEQDRSKKFHHCVGWLRDKGWEIADIIALLQKYPDGIASKYAKKKRIATEARRVFNKPNKSKDEDETETADKTSDTKSAKKSTLIYFDDAICEEISKEWIIKDVIAKDETSSWIGPPKGSKSALVTDLCVNVAAGIDWRGYKNKHRCGVVYFALERGKLVTRRLRAYAQRDDLESLPIAIKKGIIDLKNPKCVAEIVATIREAEVYFTDRALALHDANPNDRLLPRDVGVIVFDTFGKGIAVSGGEEDKAKDQNMVFANLRRVQEQTGVHIALIHHTGKDESRGARGSNAHTGDVDVLFQITSGKTIKTITITDANDQPTGALTKFEMEVIKIGTDKDGDDITTAIVDAEIEYGDRDEEKDLSPQQARAMECLINTINDVGKPAPVSSEYPRTIGKVVTIEQWKETCRRGSLTAGDEDAFRMAFKRAFEGLIARRKIGTLDGNVWIAYHDEDGSQNAFSRHGKKPHPE